MRSSRAPACLAGEKLWEWSSIMFARNAHTEKLAVLRAVLVLAVVFTFASSLQAHTFQTVHGLSFTMPFSVANRFRSTSPFSETGRYSLFTPQDTTTPRVTSP